MQQNKIPLSMDGIQELIERYYKNDKNNQVYPKKHLKTSLTSESYNDDEIKDQNQDIIELNAWNFDEYTFDKDVII